jgi:hypothetical protein
MIPSEHRIEQVMAETGMGRMQAINHLRQREHLMRRPVGNRLGDSINRTIAIQMEAYPADWTAAEKLAAAHKHRFGDDA